MNSNDTNTSSAPRRPAGAWLVAALAGLGLVAAAVPDAEARPRPTTSSFSANKQLGLGIMLGAPSGFSGKYYLSANTGVDFGVGFIGGYGNRDGLHLHADFLWHPATLVAVEPFVVPIYVGVGGRFWNFDNRRDDRFDDGDSALGVRVPLGVMMDFNNVPLDVFFELAFVLDFFVGDGGAGATLNGAIGVRYYIQ